MIFISTGSVFGSIRTNLTVIDSLSKEICHEFISDKLTADTVFLSLTEDKQTARFSMTLIDELQNKIVISSNSNKQNMYISANQINIEYEKIDKKEDELLIRKIDVNIIFRYDYNDTIKSKKYNKSYLDTISYSDIKYIEDSYWSFTQAKIPEKNHSFFEKYIEPIVFTSAAVLTTILLFSVRSN